ncbi:hypothetical protein MMC10_010446 [Thelotrema lepadinum]|nr:hypothetical protein [Thelotrema lepadinum]
MLSKTILLLSSLLALSVSAAPTLPARDTAAASPSSSTRAFLTNCWTNPAAGARSEIEFYAAYPKNFGSAAHKNNVVVTSDGSNLVWEDGGSATYQSDTFTWTITTANVTAVPAGSEVGSASFATAGNQYTLVKESEQILYSMDGFDCRVIYGAIQTNA